MRWLMLLLVLLVPLPGRCDGLSRGQLLYVPVYSHIYIGDAERPFNLAVTLSVRNTDPTDSVRLVSVEYFNSTGRLVRRYLDAPRLLAPLEATRFVIGETDTAGGSGASFLVRWDAGQQVNAPLVEAVMIGAKSGQGISFTSPAREIFEHNKE